MSLEDWFDSVQSGTLLLLSIKHTTLSLAFYLKKTEDVQYWIAHGMTDAEREIFPNPVLELLSDTFSGEIIDVQKTSFIDDDGVEIVVHALRGLSDPSQAALFLKLRFG